MKFRNKLGVVEAIQYVNSNAIEVADFVGDLDPWIENCDYKIRTLEGVKTVSIGDWIIKSAKRELDSCKPDIFEADYKEVKD